jgi:cytochrome c biogenesis protein CcmG/thiol:disulfide interchange protein DsbE
MGTDKIVSWGEEIMRMLGRCVFSVALLGFAAVAAFSFARPRIASAKAVPSADSRPGDPQLVDLAGYKDVVAKYHGKGLLVTFWATWCVPCRDEYPMIISLSKEYGPQGLAVVGVSLDEDADLGLVRQFLDKSQPGFPNYRQKPGIDADAFYQGVNPDWRGTMPQTDFYGRDGHLARYFVGQKSKEAFVQAIRLILLTGDSGQLPNVIPPAGN